MREPVYTNVYGRVLPIADQKTTECVTCRHPHWDTLRYLYVRCAMCPCANIGRNEIPQAPDGPA